MTQTQANTHLESLSLYTYLYIYILKLIRASDINIHERAATKFRIPKQMCGNNGIDAKRINNIYGLQCLVHIVRCTLYNLSQLNDAHLETEINK